MDLFSNFCNICYKTDDGSLKDISEENMKNLKDNLIIFVGHADIINHNILKLCQLCCEELSRSNKFREKCVKNLIQLRKKVFDMKSKLELEDAATAVQNTLQIFVHEVVQRRNTLEESNRPISIPADNHEIVKRSADLNKSNSTFSKIIILQSGRNECAPEFRESQVSFTHEELYMQNEMLRHSEGTTVEDFAQKNFERESSQQVNCEGIVNSRIESTSETLHVKQENCFTEDLELETNEDKLDLRMKFGFEIVTVKEKCEKSITNEVNSSYDLKLQSEDYSNLSVPNMVTKYKKRKAINGTDESETEEDVDKEFVHLAPNNSNNSKNLRKLRRRVLSLSESEDVNINSEKTECDWSHKNLQPELYKFDTKGSAVDHPLRLHERHFPTVCDSGKAKKALRDCVVCAQNDKRRRSRYQCDDCDVGLCVNPCFKIYHTQLYY